MSSTAPDPALVVPDLLQGQWSGAMILTYGADLGFFEARLAGQLAQVPLRIVLGDGTRLTEKLAEAATTGQRLRMANRSYLAASVRHPRAVHAKVILLLAPREGVLVVGSGNLGYDGYASAGELWHVYRYHDERPRHLDEFAAVRSLVDGLAGNAMLDPPTIDILRTLWGTAPWLPDTPAEAGNVRHNLDQPLIEQLAEAVDWPVRELIVHAPFHDPGCLALEALLQRFRPKRLRVLVSRATSVDPGRLEAVMAKAARSTLEEIDVASDPGTYIHAKWIHLKGDKAEALLTGSANLSKSALLRAASDGNVEAGVVTLAGKGEFAALYDHLRTSRVTDAAAIGLTYTSSDVPSKHPAYPVVLWTRLEGLRLTITFDRPVEESLELEISGYNFGLAWSAKRVDGPTVELILDSESALAAAEGGALTIHAGTDADEPSYSWPYQLEAIRGRLSRAGSRDQLTRIGDLPDRDADLWALLQELESSLVFDPITTWRIARPDIPPPSGDEGETLQWDDLDWSRIRRDRRFTGYLTQGRTLGTAPTDIQVILGAITGRLGDLGLESVLAGASTDESELAAEGTQETSDQSEDQENDLNDEAVRRSLPISTRTRMAFNRFVKRYAAAARDQAFIDELGPIVSAKNAAIFSHLLSRLIDRDAVDPEKAVDAQLAIWRLLWGTADMPGLLAILEADERMPFDRLLVDTSLREATIRAIMRTTSLDLSSATRRAVRDQLRHLISHEDFTFDADLIVKVEGQLELAPTLMMGLVDIATQSEPRELLDFVLQPLGLASAAAEWREQSVQRVVHGRPATYRAHVLEVLSPVASLGHDQAQRALERVTVAAHLGGFDDWYIRIRFAGNGSDVAFWDWETESGIVMVDGDDREINSLEPRWPAWLSKLEDVTRAVEVLPPAGVA